MADSFTMFGKFGNGIEHLDDEGRALMYRALCDYGFFGIEPDYLDPIMMMAFETMREDIDNSKSSRKSGSRGGSKRSSKGASEGRSKPEPEHASNGADEDAAEDASEHASDDASDGASDTACKDASDGASDTACKDASDGASATPCKDASDGASATPCKGGSKGGCKGGSNPDQTRPDQTSTDQTNREGANRHRRFSPPTTAEVESYAATLDGSGGFSAERFCDYYAAKGWRVGSSPMKDWKAAVRNWVRRDKAEREPERKEAASGEWNQF